jgi:hypothetical protein
VDGGQPVGRPLPTQDSTTHKGGHTSMHRAGFEPTIPVFERLKTARALDRAVIGTGIRYEFSSGFQVKWSNVTLGVALKNTLFV